MACVAGATPPQSLVKMVHAQTQGNPLFMSEVSRHLVQEGVLMPGPSASLSAQAAANARSLRVSIPEGIREAIGKRLGHLSEGCLQMISIAAVIGREFGVNELERLIDHMPEDRLLDALEEAVSAGVLEERPQSAGRYQFTHVLIRETLYDEMSNSRRSRLHRRIGEAIEELYASDLGPYLGRLSHHFFEAAWTGTPAKAIAYSSRAAERAMALLAYEEAARYYQTAIQALALQSPADEASRCKLLLALGEAHAKAGNYPYAMEAFTQAAEVAKKLGASEDLVRAALGFEDSTWKPGLFGQPAAQLLSEALNALGEGDSLLKARVLASLARALNFSGSIEQSLDMKREAVDMGRRLGDPSTLIAILRTGLADVITPGKIEERLAAEKEILELADLIEDKDETQVSTDIWIAFDLMTIGDMQGVKHKLNAIQRQAEKFRSSFIST
jgi:predicted ATPase